MGCIEIGLASRIPQNHCFQHFCSDHLRHFARSGHSAYLRRVFHGCAPASLSDIFTLLARNWLGYHCDLVGRSGAGDHACAGRTDRITPSDRSHRSGRADYAANACERRARDGNGRRWIRNYTNIWTSNHRYLVGRHFTRTPRSLCFCGMGAFDQLSCGRSWRCLCRGPHSYKAANGLSSRFNILYKFGIKARRLL